MKACPVCGSQETVVFDQRPQVPVLLNLTYATAEEARHAPRGRLTMTGCQACGFVFNADFDPALMSYTPDYENDQSQSPSFRAHLGEMAAELLSHAPAAGGIDVLEVGAGQGQFLELVAERAGKRLSSATGFDPAARPRKAGGPICLYQDYFSRETAHRLPRQPQLVVSRHTIEHVPDPVSFLKTIREGLEAAAGATILIETPCVAWIIDQRAVQDFFYEHCSLFTPYALRQALRRAGFAVKGTRHVFGGQYLSGIARIGGADAGEAPPPKTDFGGYAGAKDAVLQRWFAELAGERHDVYLWGAGAKGVTFALLADQAGQRLSGLIDINPRKQGRHVPLTGLPILAPAALAGRRCRLMIMNPNYAMEIRETCRQLGIDAHITVL